jgi:hypothetical protein
MAVPTAAQQQQIAVLQANLAANPTATNVCLLANYREMVWRGQASPGLLDDGFNGGSVASGYPQGAPGNVYMPNR